MMRWGDRHGGFPESESPNGRGFTYVADHTVVETLDGRDARNIVDVTTSDHESPALRVRQYGKPASAPPA